MKPVELAKDIFWIGAVDYNKRNFHGYSRSPRGTTYNSYLVRDEKNVVFDTVDNDYAGTMFCRLAKLMPLDKVDYIVVNHTEKDHAGALCQLVERCKPEKIITSTIGKRFMEAQFDTTGWPIEVVKTGDVINIGKRNIHFVETRMLHWPDSMVSYIPEDKLLISNDAFGQNIASSERFSDQYDRCVLEKAIKEYYYNIVLPFSPQVLKTLELVAALKLDIEMIAPDHGLIWRGKDDCKYILDTYRALAEQKPKQRAVIVYDSMWGSTGIMASAIASGLEDEGVPVRIIDIQKNHHSDVMTELARLRRGHRGFRHAQQQRAARHRRRADLHEGPPPPEPRGRRVRLLRLVRRIAEDHSGMARIHEHGYARRPCEVPVRTQA